MNIREIRRSKGITQQALAYRAGVSLSNLERAERGSHETSRENLKKIARVLGVKVDELLAEAS